MAAHLLAQQVSLHCQLRRRPGATADDVHIHHLNLAQELKEAVLNTHDAMAGKRKEKGERRRGRFGQMDTCMSAVAVLRAHNTVAGKERGERRVGGQRDGTHARAQLKAIRLNVPCCPTGHPITQHLLIIAQC